MFRTGRATQRRRWGRALPTVQVQGTAPALLLPELQLSGSVSVVASLGDSSLLLPELQLSGSLTVSAPKHSAWLRLASSTPSSGEWATVVDVIGGNNATQPGSQRKPAVGATANGLATLVFDGSDMLLWTIDAGNYATTKIGYLFWFKPALVSGVQRLLNIPSNGASIQFYASGSQLQCEIYIGAAGRFGVTASGTLQAGVWHCIYLQYDSSRGGDANLAVYVNGVAKSLTYGNLGAGATLGALQSVAGSIIIGAFNDADNPTQGIFDEGEFGPNMWSFLDNLTAEELAAYVGFDVPAFLPTQYAALSAMLDLALGTVTGNGYSSVPDGLASNPAVQTVNARRPVNGTSNAQAIATYANASATCLVWPAAANNNNDLTTIVGFAAWLKFSSYSGIFKYIIDVGGATGSYDNCKFEIAVDSSRRVNAYYFGQDTAGYNGRLCVSQSSSCPVAGTWFFLRTAFSGGQATEALRCRTWVDEVEKTNTFSNAGAGGDPRALRVCGASVPLILGNYQDGDATFGMSAVTGPLVYLIKGDISAAKGLALMNHRRPT